MKLIVRSLVALLLLQAAVGKEDGAGKQVVAVKEVDGDKKDFAAQGEGADGETAAAETEAQKIEIPNCDVESNDLVTCLAESTQDGVDTKKCAKCVDSSLKTVGNAELETCELNSFCDAFSNCGEENGCRGAEDACSFQWSAYYSCASQRAYAQNTCDGMCSSATGVFSKRLAAAAAITGFAMAFFL